jgi:hypothetical protein
VAQRIGPVPSRPSRALDERLVLRFPWLYRGFGETVGRLPPESRLRQALVRRQLVTSWQAIGRGDLDVIKVRYAPQLTYTMASGLISLGLGREARGPDAWLALEEFLTAWASWVLKLEYVIDFGDRVVTLGRVLARGAGSGVELDSTVAQYLELDGGTVLHEHDFEKWEEALAAAGLERDVLDALAKLPDGGRLILR